MSLYWVDQIVIHLPYLQFFWTTTGEYVKHHSQNLIDTFNMAVLSIWYSYI